MSEQAVENYLNAARAAANQGDYQSADAYRAMAAEAIRNLRATGWGRS